MIKYLLLLLISVPIGAFSQIGGENVFEFLMLPSSARAAYMGGLYLCPKDDDLSLAYQNPSLLSRRTHNSLSLNQYFLPSGVSSGNASYSRYYPKLRGSIHTGIQYINYGLMDRRDISGNLLGAFASSEYALFGSYARPFAERYSLGGTLKFAYSQISDYTAAAAFADLALHYEDTTHLFSSSICIKNAGLRLKNFTKTNKERLPFDVEIGIQQRLKHTPFSLSLTAHNFYRFNIRYDDPDQQINEGFITDSTAVKVKKHVFDRIARHFIIGTELYIAKVLTIGLSYNHLRRAELALDSRRKLAGFSVGFGLHLKKFDLQYAYAKYSVSGATNHISLNLKFQEFKKKNKSLVKEIKTK